MKQPRCGGRWFINFATGDGANIPASDTVVDFDGYAEAGDRISLPRYLYDEQSDLIRETVERIDEYGQLRCSRSGRNIIEELTLDDGISLWHISGPAQKCLVRNPGLGTYIKLLGLERLVRKYRPSSIATNATGRQVVTALRQIASAGGAAFTAAAEGAPASTPAMALRWRALLRFAAIAMQAAEMTRHRWRPVRRGPRGDARESVLFLGYSDNVPSGTDSSYEPRYWKGLPEIVEKAFRVVTWAHIYNGASGASRARSCRRLQEIERSMGVPHRFLLLDQFLSIRVVLRSVWTFVRLQWRLRDVENAIASHRVGSGVGPWPFFAAVWDRSMKGGTAAAQIVQKHLIDEFARAVGRQSATIYLFEGMPWEHMLLDSWRRHGNGPLFGYQHATIKSYDLRPQSYLSISSGARNPTLPEKILVNGPAATRSLQALGFTQERLVPVEATRFDYLADLVEERQASHAREHRTVLFVLEGIEPVDQYMLGLLAGIDDRDIARSGLQFVIKPHPSGRVSIANFMSSADLSPSWTESRQPMRQVLATADIVCASVNSSSATEAQSVGLPLVLIWKPSELIRSPLTIDDWSSIVSESRSLLRALTQPRTPSRAGETPFYLGRDRSWWRKVLLNAPA